MAKTPSDINGDLNNLKALQRHLRSEQSVDTRTSKQRLTRKSSRQSRQTDALIDEQVQKLDEVIRDLKEIETMGPDGWKLIAKIGFLYIPILRFQQNIDELIKSAPENVRQSVNDRVDARLEKINRFALTAMHKSGLGVVFFEIDESDPQVKAALEGLINDPPKPDKEVRPQEVTQQIKKADKNLTFKEKAERAQQTERELKAERIRKRNAAIKKWNDQFDASTWSKEEYKAYLADIEYSEKLYYSDKLSARDSEQHQAKIPLKSATTRIRDDEE
jgi:hypothetical protein